jgi:molecular chaperone GrpE
VTEPTEGAEGTGGTEGGFAFQDKRRIDPTTYQVREQAAAPAPAGAQDSSPGAPADEPAVDAADQRVAELTADLQRLQAEYVNYRKRVERDRQLVREQAVANALAELLPVLDDVDRARAHGDLEGGFKSVGEALEAVVARLGMTRYGEPGEPFDPAVHEAIALESSADVEAPTTTAVHQYGYRFAGRVVRPAVVSVAEPA